MATTKRTVEVELSTTGLDAQGRPQRVPLVDRRGGQHRRRSTAPPSLEPELEGEHMLINIGPQHPATHGVLRLVLELDGETVVRCIPHIGYLHCGFEKIGEYRQYNQIIPWTDREDYLNSPGNNVAFALGAERLFGIEITERCKVLRVIAMRAVAHHLAPASGSARPASTSAPSRRSCGSFQEREHVYDAARELDRRAPHDERSRASAAWAPTSRTAGRTVSRTSSRTFPKIARRSRARCSRKNGIWVGRTVGLGAMSPRRR